MRRPTYIGYTDFSNTLNISYADYLQAREFSDAVQTSISVQTKQLITATNKIGNSQLVATQQTSSKIGELAYQIQQSHDELKAETNAGFQRVSSVLEWGFSEIIFAVGKTNELLSELLKVEKNRSKTWAYEKFDDARDEFARGLYAESLASVVHAIDGYGSNLGYKTEYRFHYLKGLITLGSFENQDPQVIDLEESERSFLFAARYSAHDPKECANAWLCAGRAAEIRGALTAADQHFSRGLEILETAGLYYERARVRAALNRADAMIDLKSAIRFDMSLILKALRDIEFSKIGGQVDNVLISIRNELVAIGTTVVGISRNEIKSLITALYQSRLIDSNVMKIGDICREEIRKFVDQVERLAATIESGGIIDIAKELRTLRDSANTEVLTGIAVSFRRSILQALRDKLIKIQNELGASNENSLSKYSKSRERRERVPYWVGFGMFLVQILLSLTECTSRGVTDKAAGLFLSAFIMSPIYGFVAMLIAAGFGLISEGNYKATFERRQASSNTSQAMIQTELRQIEVREFYSPVRVVEEAIPDWSCGPSSVG